MPNCWKPGDPPPKAHGNNGTRPGSPKDVAAKLAKIPGQWVQVKEGLTHPAGSFCDGLRDLGVETTSRRDEDRIYAVWARYVGVETTLSLAPPYEVTYTPTTVSGPELAGAVTTMAKAVVANDRLAQLRTAIRNAPLTTLGTSRLADVLARIPDDVIAGAERPANLSELCADKKLWQRVMAWLAEESAA